MSVKFRRTKQIAPGVRLNVNKDSVGFSFGPKGMKYTVNSKGGKRATVGIPGTGLYATENLTSKSSDSRKKNQNKESTAVIKSEVLKPGFTVKGVGEPLIHKKSRRIAIEIVGYMASLIIMMEEMVFTGLLLAIITCAVTTRSKKKVKIPEVRDYLLLNDANAETKDIMLYLKVIDYLNNINDAKAEFSLANINKTNRDCKPITKHTMDKLVDGGYLNRNKGLYSLDKDTFNYFSEKQASYFAGLADKYDNIAYDLHYNTKLQYSVEDIQRVEDYAEFCRLKAGQDNTID